MSSYEFRGSWNSLVSAWVGTQGSRQVQARRAVARPGASTERQQRYAAAAHGARETERAQSAKFPPAPSSPEF